MGSAPHPTQQDSVTSIAFVGAGINALAASIALLHNDPSRYDIHIFERREEDVATGAAVAGLHLKPNSTRLLDSWDVSEFFERSRIIRATKICRYADGHLISIQQRPTTADFNDSKAKSAETWYCNRAELWGLLYRKATGLGAKVHFGKDVKGIDVQQPLLHFADGTEVSCDLVVASDGMLLVPRSALAQLTGLLLQAPTLRFEGYYLQREAHLRSPQATSFFRSASLAKRYFLCQSLKLLRPCRKSITTTQFERFSDQVDLFWQQHLRLSHG